MCGVSVCAFGRVPVCLCVCVLGVGRAVFSGPFGNLNYTVAPLRY